MTEETEAPRGFFPGSRVPLPTPVSEKSTKRKTSSGRPTTTWDARPTKKNIRGVDVEFFAIGAVCAALGRPAVTIRLWIRQGHLPQATFRMPDKNGIKGRRLYTREQVEAIIAVAEAHGIRTAERVDWSKHTTFADDVRKAWSTK